MESHAFFFEWVVHVKDRRLGKHHRFRRTNCWWQKASSFITSKRSIEVIYSDSFCTNTDVYCRVMYYRDRKNANLIRRCKLWFSCRQQATNREEAGGYVAFISEAQWHVAQYAMRNSCCILGFSPWPMWWFRCRYVPSQVQNIPGICSKTNLPGSQPQLNPIHGTWKGRHLDPPVLLWLRGGGETAAFLAEKVAIFSRNIRTNED